MALPSAPPAQFNFAQFLIAANNSRKDKTALIDDVGSLTYGQMADQIRACAAGLRKLGLKREERVLADARQQRLGGVIFGCALCGCGACGGQHFADC